MLNADDTQVYVVLNGDDRSAALSKLKLCVKDIKAWSTANFLKLNEDKTEVLHVTSRFRKSSDLPDIHIGDTIDEPTSKARNLGVIFDDNLSLDKHVNNIYRAASFALHKLGQIRNFLDDQTTGKLVHAFVTCRLDNCNSLLQINKSRNSNVFRTQQPGLSVCPKSVIRFHLF